jgi:hypothetical protein
MLAYLHENNFIKKMPTKNVKVSFGANNKEEIGLDELNELIAKERGVKVSELAVVSETPTKEASKTKKTDAKKKSTK